MWNNYIGKILFSLEPSGGTHSSLAYLPVKLWYAYSRGGPPANQFLKTLSKPSLARVISPCPQPAGQGGGGEGGERERKREREVRSGRKEKGKLVAAPPMISMQSPANDC